MTLNRLLIGGALALCAAACSPAPDATAPDVARGERPAPIPTGPDPHSYANHDAVAIDHMTLDLDVDLRRRVLDGFVVLDLERIEGAAAERLVLDTRQLEIRDVNRVLDDDALEPLSWRLGEGDPDQPWLGRPLVVALPGGADRVRIDYSTTPEAYGLQWLDGRQTLSGRPFLFSQSQPIFARTWVPLQDTPGVRYTFDATVRVPRGLIAVMGAGGNPTEPAADGTYTFTMPQPIPSYLMAIAVGELEFREIGPRSGVYAEPSRLEAAAYEFGELEEMIDVGEALYGDYRWDRYDLLILPPSFPFGGMENPRLSFITPTVIAGDRSLTALIAHELAHSWSGNLVTNAAWRDLWLNEGFTTYFESRIVENLYGTRRKDMEGTLDFENLKAQLEELSDAEQVLARDLVGQDPEASFTGIPYDKGRLFLQWLEARVGREAFDAFLTDYFDHFAFESIDTEDFLAYLDTTLLAEHGERVTKAELEEWIYAPGLPDDAVIPQSDAFEIVNDYRRQWLAGEIELADIPTADWTVSEWRRFLLGLGDVLTLEQMAELDAAYDLTGSGNVEILYLWLVRAIETRYEPGLERLESFLVDVGRNKFTRPLYEELAATDWGRDRAIEIYQRARPRYHPMTRAAAERALGIDG
ncbi:M1 family metallopeptidase [Wenzhouxiangella sp. XN79A]|uniref:M1 family metallopeptidase n=1 Tax=Wenzhouxiangella sp. XN79A TaxID=2724193 RepID=UPI00144A9E63|nr:M1 family metallopeptidase [Wenzhouxiangella sp. XN79A]NKI36235.1 M1 family metallopeptidase [Wenzhouxiangella sp. XN79A]